MGFFDYIGGKIQQVGADVQAAQMEAEHWDAIRICRELERCSSMTKSQGYMRELNCKCKEMEVSELKYTFDEAYDRRNTKALSAIMPIMKERGLADRDDNGRIIRNY